MEIASGFILELKKCAFCMVKATNINTAELIHDLLIHLDTNVSRENM